MRIHPANSPLPTRQDGIIIDLSNAIKDKQTETAHTNSRYICVLFCILTVLFCILTVSFYGNVLKC